MCVRDWSRNADRTRRKTERETIVEENLQYLHSQCGLQITLSQDASVIWRGLCCFMWSVRTVYHLRHWQSSPGDLSWHVVERGDISHPTVQEGEKTLSLVYSPPAPDGNEGIFLPLFFFRSFQAAATHKEIWQIDHVWSSQSLRTSRAQAGRPLRLQGTHWGSPHLEVTLWFMQPTSLSDIIMHRTKPITSQCPWTATSCSWGEVAPLSLTRSMLKLSHTTLKTSTGL